MSIWFSLSRAVFAVIGGGALLMAIGGLSAGASLFDPVFPAGLIKGVTALGAAIWADGHARWQVAVAWLGIAAVLIGVGIFGLNPCLSRAYHWPGFSRFRDFFDAYAAGAAMAKQREDMYSLRSGILHGRKLMQVDQDLSWGWAPPWWNEIELHAHLWGLTRLALRSWLKHPPGS